MRTMICSAALAAIMAVGCGPSGFKLSPASQAATDVLIDSVAADVKAQALDKGAASLDQVVVALKAKLDTLNLKPADRQTLYLAIDLVVVRVKAEANTQGVDAYDKGVNALKDALKRINNAK